MAGSALSMCFLLVGPFSSISLAITEQVPFGARAVAMGGAYSAVTDDASAIFWNPAGLLEITSQEVAFSHANLFGTGINDNQIGFAAPVTRRQALGFDYYQSGFRDDELNASEGRFDIAFAQRVVDWASVGGVAKYMTRSAELDGTSIREGSGFGLDLGVRVSPIPSLSLALVGQDVTDSRIRYTTGAATATVARTLRAAAAYAPIPDATVALDIDDRYHVGAEYRPLPMVALRAGVQQDRDRAEGATWAVGTGFRWGNFRFDWAREQHPVLGVTHHFGLACQFSFSPVRIRIEEVRVPDALFASLYQTYARDSIGTVRILNRSRAPIEGRLNVEIRGLTVQARTDTFKLAAGAAATRPIHADLSPSIVSDPLDAYYTVKVTAEYDSRQSVRKDSQTADTYVYPAGRIRWDDGVEQVAALVTIRDPMVDSLANRVFRATEGISRGAYSLPNVRFAAAAFDALGALGVAYRPDPDNAYGDIRGRKDAVDMVRYPWETLQRRTGDCDDTTVLTAALLGSQDIRTVFADSRDHIFLLFDSGLHPSRALALDLPSDYYVVDDDAVWIPLETTLISRGFAEAWKRGSEVYRELDKRGDLRRYDVFRAQLKYPAITPTHAVGDMVAPDEQSLRERLGQDGSSIASWRQMFEGAGSTADTVGEAPASALSQALLEYLAGDLELAARRLQAFVAQSPNSAAGWNDLGVVLAGHDSTGPAIERFEHAAALEPADAGIWLNLGLARVASGDSVGGEETIARGIEQAGGISAACALLGIRPPVAQSAERLAPRDAAQLLMDALTHRDGLRSDAVPPLLDPLYWKE